MITDFNISKYSENKTFKMLTYTGTEAFKAPEMLEGSYYDEKIDLWAAGCVLYTMLSGVMPFFDENLPRLHKSIRTGTYDLKSEPWPSISDCAKDLIKKLICVDPKERLSANEALMHEWIITTRVKSCSLVSVANRMSILKSYKDKAGVRFSDNYYPPTEVNLLCERKSLLYS